MLKKILLGLAVVIGVILLAAAFQPAAYRVVRSTTISAPAATVFAQVNDLHSWQEFSPWAKLDPDVKNTYDGPRAGVGASMAWNGNSKVGEGRMTITASRPVELVGMKLEFIRPFADTSAVEFTLKPEGPQTQVSWSMAGQKNYMSKVMCLFVSMDKMVGGDFEQGLANLKTITEAKK